MKIAIEGMDGVGKSTIAKELAKRNEFTYIGDAIHKVFDATDKESEYYKIFKRRENQLFFESGNDILRAWLCSLGNIYTATQVKDKNIVVDRHILSNFQQNGTRENIEIYKTLLSLIGVPDMSVILYASPEVRLQRIYTRNKNDRDLQDEAIKADGYKGMIKFAEKFNMPHFVIDTEEKSIDDIVQEIEEKVIKKIKGEELDER